MCGYYPHHSPLQHTRLAVEGRSFKKDSVKDVIVHRHATAPVAAPMQHPLKVADDALWSA